jgi:ABC-2 type transport system permease protein
MAINNGPPLRVPSPSWLELPPLPELTFTQQVARYVRLWLVMTKFSLVRELSFRTNFVVKVFVEVLWLGILLAFYDTIFKQTDSVAGWERSQYLFFLGCYFTMGGLMETLFLENCNQFADLVRTGSLDFYLVQPIDEQFLVTCRTFDWSCFANVLMGCGIMIFSLDQQGWPITLPQVLLFLAMFGCGAVLAYSFLLLLTSASVWMMRNQSLFEIWWLFTTLMRYPREIYNGRWSSPVGFIFSFAVPIMLVTNIPARVMRSTLQPEPWELGYTVLATVVVFMVSRRFFRMAMQRYRSASS